MGDIEFRRMFSNPAVTTLTALDGDLRDALDLFELAREEGDEDTLVASEEDPRSSRHAWATSSSAGCSRTRPTRTTASSTSRRAGGDATGHRCCCASTCATANARASRPKCSKVRRRRRRHQNATVKVSGEYAYGFLRTETGIHRLVRKSPFDSSGGRHVVLVGVRVPGNRRFDRSRDQPGRPAHRHVPRIGRGRSAHQQDRLRGADHACRPVSSCSARTTARSTATAPKRWRC